MAVKKLDETTYEVSAVREGEEFKHLKEHVLVHFKDAKVDGFRPGHVPANVIEKNFKKEIDGEILNHIISDEYQKAVAENELKPIADIKLEKYEIQADKAEVVFTIPVLPLFELGQYAEDEEAKNDDVVNINFEGFVDGVAFDGGKAEGYDLTLGSHSFIDTFEDQIVGHKKNDEFDVNVKFPEAYHAENLKGKPALFKVKVNSIKRKEEAELNDDLAKELGFESVDDMRAKTRENITKREEARVENEFKNKIIEKVVDGTNVEAPRALVDREIEFQINRFAQQLQMQGINLSQYFQMTGQTIDKMREDSREMAEKSVKTELVLSEISKVENITVTDEEVDNEFEVMATMYGMDKATMLDEVKKSGNYQRFVDEAKYRLVNQKTIDLLVKETKVK